MKPNFEKTLFDTRIFETNLLKAHSTFNTFLDEKSYFANKTVEENLNGIWKGIYLKKFDEDILKYLLPKADISKLSDIEVPLSIELQGFTNPQYVNYQYPFDGYNTLKVGEKINVDNPVILYLKDLQFSKIDENKKYIIDFKGFETGLFLYVNNQYVGYSENLYLDSEFDISKYLQKGKNRIAAFVFKYSSSSWLLSQDFFRFHGIFRDVTLSIVPKNHIDDIEFKSEIDLNSNSANISINLAGNISNLNKKISIIDREGKIVFEGETRTKSLKGKIENINLWSDENPYLYDLIVKSYDDKKLIEIDELNIGFRDVRIADSKILFNGKRFIIHGVNRHEWDMNRGRNVTDEDMKFDIKFLKRRNINAVRTCHYPDNTKFYSLADEYGICLLDEACLESHGSLISFIDQWSNDTSIPGSRKEWENLCINKVLRMYERDKNHPSVFMYSLGNESGIGDIFVSMRNALKKRNPNIIIHYEQVYIDFKKYGFVSDVYTNMYTKPADLDDFLKTHQDKPYLLCEYSHAMGNSNGNVDEYMALIDKYKTFCGGFIWDYIDQGLYLKNDTDEKHLSYGGDFFDRPNDKNFCCNGIINADRKEAEFSSKAIAFKYYYQPYKFIINNKNITIFNKQKFVDSSSVIFSISLLANGIIKEQKDFDLTINPNDKKTITLNFKYQDKDTEEIVYRVEAKLKNDTLYADKGYVVANEDKVIKNRTLLSLPKEKLKIVVGTRNIGVFGSYFSYLFSFLKPEFSCIGFQMIKVNDDSYLADYVYPNVFRANTDNDFGNHFNTINRTALAGSRELECPINNVIVTQKNNSIDISYKYFLNKDDSITILYQVNQDGSILVTETSSGFKSIASLATFGLDFILPKPLIDFSYYGLGPNENYPDRKKGALLSIYKSNSLSEYNHSNYIRPQACGNHTETREITIDNKNSQLKFVAVSNPFNFSYLPYSQFEIENANHVYELPTPHHNYLHIAGFERGIGGDDSWGAPVHKQYELDGKKKYSFSFLIIPIKK